MNKKIAVLLAFIMGFTYWPIENVAEAAENKEEYVGIEENEKKSPDEEEKILETDENGTDQEETENSFFTNLLSSFYSEKEAEENPDKKTKKAEDKKSAVPETSALKNLQIPQKLDVIIDPWEMDARGQVYSEKYIIGNTGDTPGILTLSGLACRPREQSGVIVRTDKEGLHDSGDKSIYMEMLLGNGERIVFSQESSRYQTELKPGEQISICFTGEVNENAFGKWQSNDIAVSVVYSWETEEERNAMAAESGATDEKTQADADINKDEISEKKQEDIGSEEINKKTQEDISLEEINERTQDNTDSEETIDSNLDLDEQTEKPDNDTEKEELEESKQEVESDEVGKDLTADKNSDLLQEASSESSVEGMKEPEAGDIGADGSSNQNLKQDMEESLISNNAFESTDEEKEKIKNVDLQDPQKVDVIIDSWKIDEKGRIVSPEFLLKNNGSTTGIWTLSELVCKPKDQSAVVIKAEKDELSDSDEKSVYMELRIDNGEKVVLTENNSQYKVELEPGETLSVCFLGEMKGNLFENSEDGDITVTAVCTWVLK